jgi:hypothetical protein
MNDPVNVKTVSIAPSELEYLHQPFLLMLVENEEDIEIPALKRRPSRIPKIHEERF